MRTNDELIMEQMYTEGLFDRMKAKHAGRVAERGAGAGFKAKALGGIGKATTGSAGKFQKTLDAGTEAKNTAQIEAITSAYMGKLTSIANKYANDIKKLGIDVSMIDDDAARKIIIGLLKYGQAPVAPAPTTIPPPAPTPKKKAKKP
jgi:hypothetical protein